MAIDVRSISITGAFNAIKSFFLSQENNSRWKDTETGAEGNFLTRLLANVIRVISQNCITGRRECNLDTANLLSSNIGIGVTTGSYPTFRGRNQRRLINFTPKDNMTIPKFTKIGTYSEDCGIYTINDLTFIAGESQEFSVVLGELKEISWNANTTSLKKFHRFEQGISEDVDLLVDGTSMTEQDALSKYVKDMVYDKYCILTNPWKSVTIQYLNNAANATHKYSADTTFTLKYIELADIEVGDFSEEMFADYGKLNTILTIENFIPFEEVDSIKMNAPVHREVQSLVRSKVDFADLVREFVASVIQTTHKALTPTYTAVAYRKRDKSLMEAHEKEELMKALNPCMAFGRPYPDIVDPVREITTLDVTIGATNRYTDEASITADVQNMVNSNYADKLDATFDVYDFENMLNKLNYAKYSRVNIHINERTPLTQMKVGDHITANNLYYKCTGILGQTGINEPTWNIPSDDSTVKDIYTGLKTQDNTLLWACYKRLNIEEIQSWKPGKKIKLGEFVYSDSIPQYMFKAVGIVRLTDVTGPDVSGIEVGDYVQDGETILLCITYNDSYDDRKSNYNYKLGDKFNYSGLSFEYVGMVGKTGSDETLTFNNAEYTLTALTGSDYDKAHQIDGQTCLYIDDTSVANMVNRGDVLRVNLVEQVDKKWEEVPADQLTMGTKLDAEVKKYEDKEEEPDDEGGGGEGSNISVTVQNFYTGNVIPDISHVELGDSISDGDFTLNCVPFDDTYPERISAFSYNNNDRFTITAWKTVTDPETSTETEVVDRARSFAVVTPILETEVTPSNEPEGEEEEPEVQNAGWKELEKYLKLEEEIHEWVASEAADKLRCPADVIEFLYEIGRFQDFDEKRTAVEVKEVLLQTYYQQYDEYDEKQIYMYMDAMDATRAEAISDMKTHPKGTHCRQLKDPIADANCVKQYDADGKLVYVDRYSQEMDIHADDGVTYKGYTVTRIDRDLIERAVRTYIYKDGKVVLYTEVIHNDSKSVSNVYLVTAANADVRPRDFNGKIRNFTRIVPTTAIPKYTEGYVNISFKKTDDGDIRWEQVTDVDSIKYDWDTFANYDVNLTVKY